VKNAVFCNVKESITKFLDLDPDANDFQNLISSSLSRHISDKIFMKI